MCSFSHFSVVERAPDIDQGCFCSCCSCPPLSFHTQLFPTQRELKSLLEQQTHIREDLERRLQRVESSLEAERSVNESENEKHVWEINRKNEEISKRGETITQLQRDLSVATTSVNMFFLSFHSPVGQSGFFCTPLCVVVCSCFCIGR